MFQIFKGPYRFLWMHIVILPHLKVLEKDFAKGSEFLSGKLVVEGAGAPCTAEESCLSFLSSLTWEGLTFPMCSGFRNRKSWQQLCLVCSKKITRDFLGSIKKAMKLVTEKKNPSQLCQDPICSMQETGFVRFAVLHLFMFVLHPFYLIKLCPRPASAS